MIVGGLPRRSRASSHRTWHRWQRWSGVLVVSVFELGIKHGETLTTVSPLWSQMIFCLRDAIFTRSYLRNQLGTLAHVPSILWISALWVNAAFDPPFSLNWQSRRHASPFHWFLLVSLSLPFPVMYYLHLIRSFFSFRSSLALHFNHAIANSRVPYLPYYNEISIMIIKSWKDI